MLEVCEGRHEWVQVLRAAMKATVCERGGDLQRFMELVGFGGTGKGSIIRLVTALVGKENIAVTDLKQLEKNRFETAALYGKKAIIITDSERYAGDVSVLKALTGNDEVRHEKKGIQQTGGFRFKGMVWIAANEAIQSADYTSGLKRRRLSMPFDRVVPSHLRRDLESEFQPYLANFLQWVLEMPDAEVSDYVRNTDKVVRSLANFNAEILLETNPIALWADSYLVLDPKGKTYVGNKGMSSEYFLFASYANWAETAGYSPVAQARFSRNLLDLLKSQLGITEATKGRDNKGAYITGVLIRYSNDLAHKRLITSEELVTGCNDLSDPLVTDKVTVQTLVSDGFFESDGSITNSNLSDAHELKVPDNKKDLPEFSQDASHPSNPSPVMVTTDNEPVTDDGKTHHHLPLLSLMIEVWDDIAALGKLVLTVSESDLVAATFPCNPQQIAHIKAAARSMWRPGVNRDVDYLGDRCSVWEAGGREITIQTPAGTRLKVKEGTLRPWLGI
jgi:putative DNA primase/helicase